MDHIPLDLILATGPQGEFACDEGLPWPKISSDLQFFAQTTRYTENPNKMNAVIMGRLTFESLPGPLKGRRMVVLSSSSLTLKEALESLDQDQQIEKIFVIGGISLFMEVISSFRERCRYLYHTLVPQEKIMGTHIRCIDLKRLLEAFPSHDDPIQLPDGTIRQRFY